VIELVSTSGGDDSTGETLESRLVGLNGDRDWLLGNGGHELLDISSWDICVAYDCSDTIGFIVYALVVLAGVRVICLSLEWVALNVFEGVVHESSLTSIVSE